MDQKQLKRNLNYFTKSDTPLYVGICMLVVGVALYFFGYSYVIYILASVLAVAGLVLMLIGTSGRVTDADIDTCIRTLTEGMAVDVVENPKLAKRMLPHVPVLHLQSYLYEDNLRFKLTKSGAVRSELYEAAILYALDSGLYVVRRRVSLLSDLCEQQVVEIPYADLEKIEVIGKESVITVGKRTRTLTSAVLCIRGAQPMEIPMQSTADVDDFIARMARVLSEQSQKDA